MKLTAGMVYDIVLALCVLFIVWRGWHQGLLSELVRIAGWVAAAVLVSMYAAGWAESIYAAVVEPRAVSAVEAAIPPDVLAAMESGALAVESLQRVLDSLQGFFGGQTMDPSTANWIIQMLRQDAGSLAQLIEQYVLRPVLVSAVQALLSLLVLGGCLTVSRLLARLVAARKRDGILSMTNRLLGMALGLGEGLLTGWIFVSVLTLLAGLFHNDIISPEILQSTYLVRLLL